MTRHGYTSAGRQRWRCRLVTLVGLTVLTMLLSVLMSSCLAVIWRQTGDMPGQGRSFRRRCMTYGVFGRLPHYDEVHDVVFVDDIHLGRKAVVLIACTLIVCWTGMWLARRTQGLDCFNAAYCPTVIGDL